MGFTPGFDAYKVMIPDVAGYKPYSIYGNQKTVDNRSARRLFGGTDQLHNEMVNSQYKYENKMPEEIKDVNKKIDELEAAAKRYMSKDTVISIGGYEFTPAKLMVAANIVNKRRSL